ncbi:hypothetical protein SCOCK_10181 [Actinacidiphila cocklensis]|uniref:Uncharacterized protein n=1 Tax=Actinacidiphila cocklensis TaxID=887465 RepID=A0A9W4DIL9_9ACTN|nr:hypothetical protein SCOCK_10181 [Actinacidiphila cocklensis]
MSCPGEVDVVAVLVGQQILERRQPVLDTPQRPEVVEPFHSGGQYDEEFDAPAGGSTERMRQSRRYEDQPALRHRCGLRAEQEVRGSAEHVEQFGGAGVEMIRRPGRTRAQAQPVHPRRATVGQQPEDPLVGQGHFLGVPSPHHKRSRAPSHGVFRTRDPHVVSHPSSFRRFRSLAPTAPFEQGDSRRTSAHSHVQSSPIGMGRGEVGRWNYGSCGTSWRSSRKAVSAEPPSDSIPSNRR